MKIDESLSSLKRGCVVCTIKCDDAVGTTIADLNAGGIIGHSSTLALGESITELTVTDGCRDGAVMRYHIKYERLVPVTYSGELDILRLSVPSPRSKVEATGQCYAKDDLCEAVSRS